MYLPPHIPYLKSAALLVGMYAAVWSALEGALLYDLLLAVPALALFMGWLVTDRMGGRTLPPGRAVALAVAAGAIYGVGVALLTLGLMALKTGLHAHGPEYSTAQIVWVWRQAPLWAVAGALAGLGLGLVAAGRRN